MLIDTHAHLNFNAFQRDADEVIRRSLNNGIWMINVGSNYETSKKAVEIAAKTPLGVFAAVGLHPINLDTGLVKIKYDEEEGSHLEKEFDYEKYKELAKSKKVVAIGEIGLDYYWRPKTTKKKEIFKQKQKDLLFKQLSLAKELNLPIIFHCRVAHDDLIDFLIKNPEIRPEKAVAHGFVGNLEQLKKYLDFGFYVGFNGIIFKKIEGINRAHNGKLCAPVNFEEIIQETPLGKILVETDCPYLLPPPAEAAASADSKISRNEPLFVKYVVQEIARIKNLSFEEIAEITTKNAKNLFKI
jgi:TatD DNase family protein